MSWGAVLQDLRLAGHDAPLVLGFDSFADYPGHSPYFGAIAGRYANRIRGGRFTIAGKRYQTDTQFPRQAHAAWRLARVSASGSGTVSLHGEDFVTLTLHSPDGDMGFPGALDVTCTYRLKIPGTLVDRTDRDQRRADAVQSRPPFLFQPRRWRQPATSSTTG